MGSVSSNSHSLPGPVLPAWDEALRSVSWTTRSPGLRGQEHERAGGREGGAWSKTMEKRKEIPGGFLVEAELGLAQSLPSRRKGTSSENRNTAYLSVHTTWA